MALGTMMAMGGRFADAAGGLQGLRWDARIVVLDTDHAENEHYARQRAILDEDEAGLRERDIVVIRLVGDEVSSTPDVEGLEAGAIRETLGLDGAGFTVLLIGKDGTVKRRSHEPVSLSSLFEQIDAMPMRRREMREQGN